MGYGLEEFNKHLPVFRFRGDFLELPTYMKTVSSER